MRPSDNPEVLFIVDNPPEVAVLWYGLQHDLEHPLIQRLTTEAMEEHSSGSGEESWFDLVDEPQFPILLDEAEEVRQACDYVLEMGGLEGFLGRVTGVKRTARRMRELTELSDAE